MGEIKSTLDLVMEKTKDITLTEEDKERLRREGLTRNAESLARRYWNREISLNQLLKEVAREHDIENQRTLKQVLTGSLVGLLTLDKPNAHVLEALRPFLENHRPLQELEALETEYNETRNAHYSRIAEKLRSYLVQRGISGSAIVSKVESSEAWQQVETTFELQFRRKLEQVKVKLLSSP